MKVILSQRLISNSAAEKIMMFVYKQIDEGDEDVFFIGRVAGETMVPGVCGGREMAAVGKR